VKLGGTKRGWRLDATGVREFGGAQHFMCGKRAAPQGARREGGCIEEEFLTSLRRGEGTSYIAPAVAGSNPASDESRCSSKWQSNGKALGPPIPAARVSGVVNVRVTSTLESAPA
jgi:hypothetical protein